MSRSRRAGRLLTVGAASLVALLLAGPAALADDQGSGPPDGTPGRWSLSQGGSPLSVVDRNSYDEQSGKPREVSGTAGAGRAIEFTVPGGGQRSEVRPRVPRAIEGTVQDVTYRGRLARDFPADADGWQILLQWHQSSDEGSPPVAVEVNKGRLMLDNGENNQVEIGRVQAGDTVDLRLRVLFSKSRRTGTVDVWNAGRQVLAGYQPPEGTLQADGRNYMKVGLYRSDSIDQDGTVTVDDLQVATNPTGSGDPAAPPGPGVAPVVSAVLLLVVGGAVVVVLVRRARRREPVG